MMRSTIRAIRFRYQDFHPLSRIISAKDRSRREATIMAYAGRAAKHLSNIGDAPEEEIRVVCLQRESLGPMTLDQASKEFGIRLTPLASAVEAGEEVCGLRFVYEGSEWGECQGRGRPTKYEVRQVFCVESGKKYQSMGRAAAELDVCRSAIQRSCVNGSEISGRHFEYVGGPKPKPKVRELVEAA